VTQPLFILEQVERSINGKRSKYIEKENQGGPLPAQPETQAQT